MPLKAGKLTLKIVVVSYNILLYYRYITFLRFKYFKHTNTIRYYLKCVKILKLKHIMSVKY